MRNVIAVLALLAVAASSRDGCGKEPYEPCAGKACGAPCTLCDPADRDCAETAVVKACSSEGACLPANDVGCGSAGPCSGQACGAPCTIEPPCRLTSPPCMAPSIAGFCDGKETCVEAEPVCAPPPVDPCAGKACGDSCNPCGDANPCPTFAATACDLAGRCVTAPVRCDDPCAGKACGEACNPCAPGTACPAILCITSCDAGGRCTCTGTSTCR